MRRLQIGLALAVSGPVAAKSATTASSVGVATLHLLAGCIVDRYRPAIRKLLALRALVALAAYRIVGQAGPGAAKQAKAVESGE